MSEGENGLPPGWAAAPLQDVAESWLGKMLDKAKHTSGRRLPYLRNVNVRWGHFDLSDVADMYFGDHELERYGLRLNDVLVCEGGEPGRAAVWEEPVIGFKFQKAIHRVRPSNALLPKWLVFSLKLDANCGRLSKYFTGTTIKHLTGASISRYHLRLPPLNEQRRIVAKIEALQARSDAAKQALDAIPPLLEKFRQSVLAAAFRGDLTRAWREAHPDVEPASVLLERIRAERRRKWEEAKPGKKYVEPERVDAPDGGSVLAFGTPEHLGWAATTLETVVDPLKGIPYGIVQTGEATPDGVPTVRCGDIKSFVVDPSGLKRVDPNIHRQYLRTELSGGEVLIAVRGTVGATAVVPSGMAGMNISREVAMIPLLPGVASRYIMYLLASPPGQQLVHRHVKGVAQAGINLADLRRLPIPLPALEEQNRIVTAVDAACSLLDILASRLEEKRRALGQLNQSILAKAFRGALVPQDPTDEPAHILLDRIRAERLAADATTQPRKRGRTTKTPAQ